MQLAAGSVMAAPMVTVSVWPAVVVKVQLPDCAVNVPLTVSPLVPFIVMVPALLELPKARAVPTVNVTPVFIETIPVPPA